MFLLTTLLLAQLSIAAPDAWIQGSRVAAPPSLVQAGSNTGSRILFLNRCEGGCEISPGFEDSRTNHSSIIESVKYVSEWSHGDANWEEMLSCVRGLYAPFDVLVTDTDPGMEPHFEAIVAGTPAELGFPRAGGVAPFSCGVIDNAITYTFASIYTTMLQICNVVGQESAHAFGLDHELEACDPLTYLGGCPVKSFQDIDAQCGEFAVRECSCGGETQNSFVFLEELFGAGIVPEVSISEPAQGASVPLGFSIRATAIDDLLVTRSELWIDERLVDSVDTAPFEYQAPRTLSPGTHQVEVRVFDDRDQYGSQSIEIDQEPCLQTSACDFAYVCIAGQCTLGPGNAGGLGDRCEGSEDCQSSRCATDGNLGSFCAADCEQDPASCPHGYVCVSARDGQQVCLSDHPPNTGGFCSASGGSAGASWALLLLLWALCGTRSSYGRGVHRRPQG